jgi:hypothetical protein
VLDLGDGRSLVLACDSTGGIGSKPADTVVAAASEVAHFAARVALIEVLASGAEPVVLVNNLCVERTPTGDLMIDSIERLVAGLGGPPVAITGSTEDNVVTMATAVGVTVIGAVFDDEFRPGTSTRGDVVLCVGRPLSAPMDNVRSGDPKMIAVDEIRRVLSVAGVHDVLPVGSRGIAYEGGELARAAGLVFEPAAPIDIDVYRSGGPSTCVLASCAPGSEGAIQAIRSSLPVTVVGTLRNAA